MEYLYALIASNLRPGGAVRTLRVTKVQVVGGPLSGDPACVLRRPDRADYVPMTAPVHIAMQKRATLVVVQHFTRGRLLEHFAATEFPRGAFQLIGGDGSVITVLAADTPLITGKEGGPVEAVGVDVSTPEGVCAFLTSGLESMNGPILGDLSKVKGALQILPLKNPVQNAVVLDRWDVPEGAAQFVTAGGKRLAAFASGEGMTAAQRKALVESHAAMVAAQVGGDEEEDYAWASAQMQELFRVRSAYP